MVTFQCAINKIVEVKSLINIFPYLNNITIAERDQEDDKCVKMLIEEAQCWWLIQNENKLVLFMQRVSVLGYKIGNCLDQPDKFWLQPFLDLEMPKKTLALKQVSSMFTYYVKWMSCFSDHAEPPIRTKQFSLDAEAWVIQHFKATTHECYNALRG